MSYIGNTDADRAEMLAALGLDSIDQLFDDIPANVRRPGFNLPTSLTEIETMAKLRRLAQRNWSAIDHPIFLGAGVYNHFIPAVVSHIIGRSEFATSYTPYQPEVSQGTLQTIYEYQSLVCALTGMEVANASMYDGASAVAEAASMASAVTERSVVVTTPGVHHEYVHTLKTYIQGRPMEHRAAGSSPKPGEAGVSSLKKIAGAIDESVACVIIQQPNFFGHLEDLKGLIDACHQAGALAIVAIQPVTLGLLAPPGEVGADIVVGEGQPLGIPMSFGGPYLGLFACRQELIRQMPGRLVGATTDSKGKVGYVLTFQAREQHIRREKATSNICSNEALCALASTVYLSWMGPSGLGEAADLSFRNAHYLAGECARLPGYQIAFKGDYFLEFALKCPRPAVEINRALLECGIIGGYDLGNVSPELDDCLLLCCTEMTKREQIDQFVSALADIGAAKPATFPAGRR